MKIKHSPPWLDALKRLKVNVNQLDFNELKAFKDVDRYLNEPIEGPKEWQYMVGGFRHLTSFAFLLIYEKKYPSLSNCWDELSQLFINENDFNDEVFVESWIFCDFQFGPKKETVLDFFEKYMENTGYLDNFQPFIDSMRASRLGLYQEKISSKKTIKMSELFTKKVISIENSILDYESGEIFLTRLIEINGSMYSFGDPQCWPKAYKDQLEDMINAKLFYFKAASFEERYQQFMKYAGPYWMSCTTNNHENPILNPDHYLTYL